MGSKGFRYTRAGVQGYIKCTVGVIGQVHLHYMCTCGSYIPPRSFIFYVMSVICISFSQNMCKVLLLGEYRKLI